MLNDIIIISNSIVLE